MAADHLPARSRSIRRVQWHRLCLNIALLFLSSISGYATYTGFAAFFDADTAGVGLALAFTVAVQALVLVAAHGAFRDYAAGILIWPLVYVCGVLVSTSFGFGFYSHHFSGKALATETYRREATGVATAAIRFATEYRALANISEQIAQHSTQREHQERAVGGTCGGAAQAGEGPRQRLRARDAILFASFGRRLGDAADRADTIAADIGAAASEYGSSAHTAALSRLDRAITTMRALREDPALVGWRDAVRVRLAKSHNGIVDPETGERFNCPDGVLEAKLRSASDLNLPSLPEVMPRVFEADNVASVRRAVVLLTGQVIDWPEPRPTFDPDLDALPLGLGIGIDLIIGLLTLFKRMTYGSGQGRTSNLANLQRRFDAAPGLKPEVVHTLRRLAAEDLNPEILELLDRFVLEQGSRLYIVVPVGADEPVARRLSLLIRVLVAGDMASRSVRLHVGQLPEWWRKNHELGLAGVQHVQLFRLKRGAIGDLLVELLRDSDSWRDAAERQNRRNLPSGLAAMSLESS